jgi:hypothetical protein
MILREKDFYLAAGTTRLFVDMHFTLRRVHTLDLLGTE